MKTRIAVPNDAASEVPWSHLLAFLAGLGAGIGASLAVWVP